MSGQPSYEIPREYINKILEEVRLGAALQLLPAEVLAVEELLDQSIRKKASGVNEVLRELYNSDISQKDPKESVSCLRDKCGSVVQATPQTKSTVRAEVCMVEKFPAGFGRLIKAVHESTRLVCLEEDSEGIIVTHEEDGLVERQHRYCIGVSRHKALDEQDIRLSPEFILAHELFHLLYKETDNEFRPQTKNHENRKDIEHEAANSFAKMFCEGKMTS